MPENIAVDAKSKKKWFKKWWVWLIAIFVIGGIANTASEQEPSSIDVVSEEAVVASTETSNPEEVVTTTAETTVVETTVPVTTIPQAEPLQQQQFMQVIEDGRSKVRDASTDLQRSAALRDRDKALCGVLSSYTASDWIGEIRDIGANGEGKAYITIVIGEDARVQTWNNAFSDIGDDTLIPDTNPIFDVILPLEKGDKVKFSAKFIKGRDTCLRQGNLTETYYGTDPEFIVRFSKVEPVK